MRQKLSFVVALALVSPALAQGPDTLDSLWHFQDAVPAAPGLTDLRFSFGWESGTLNSEGDELVLTPRLIWGFSEGHEVSLAVPIWLGDAGNRGDFEDGNYDAKVGWLFRVMEQEGDGPAVAMAVNLRVPTGDNSENIDGEFRLIATRDYGDNGLRSHCNLFVKHVSGSNNRIESDDRMGRRFGLAGAKSGENDRDFQYGVVLGMDGPLCKEGAVRWVFDYMHRSSMTRGENNWNVAAAGWEWTMSEADRLGMSVQVNLDRSTDGADVGAVMTFAHALTY